MEPSPPILELRGITKQFPGVLANDHIDLDLKQGEVHALLGENGAGKSTLMNILYGLYKPDEGEIHLRGKPVTFASAKDAIAQGIGMVHQHFMLIPVMTVAENIVLATVMTGMSMKCWCTMPIPCSIAALVEPRSMGSPRSRIRPSSGV